VRKEACTDEVDDFIEVGSLESKRVSVRESHPHPLPLLVAQLQMPAEDAPNDAPVEIDWGLTVESAGAGDASGTAAPVINWDAAVELEVPAVSASAAPAEEGGETGGAATINWDIAVEPEPAAAAVVAPAAETKAEQKGPAAPVPTSILEDASLRQALLSDLLEVGRDAAGRLECCALRR
jgi:hypothetical protein